MSWDATGYGGHLGTAVDRAAPALVVRGRRAGLLLHVLPARQQQRDARRQCGSRSWSNRDAGDAHRDGAAGTRKTLYAGDVAGLVNRSFATVIESDVPIVAERAMYFGESPFWLGGHGSAGVPEPAYHWFHAEGATGSLFDTFILLANPQSGRRDGNVTTPPTAA